MTTQTALGSSFYVGTSSTAYDISGDTNSLSSMRITNNLLDVSPINVSGTKRIYGKRTGEMTASVYFNDAALQEHVALSGLTRSDVLAMWTQASTIGSSALAMPGKQINYDPSAGQDGGILTSVQWLSSGAPLEAGQLLTAGLRTDTGATNGTSLDGAAATAFGMSAYVFVTEFTGTDITLTIQDSANNSSFSAITAGAFTAFTGIGAQRLKTAIDGDVRRYVRVASSTTGGFSSCTFVVMFVRHPITPKLW